MNNLAISCQKVSKKFHILNNENFWKLILSPSELPFHDAVQSITLDVPKGKFIGILGRNGSGKSTLLRTIGGIYHPTQGLINLSSLHSAIYELGVTGNELLTGRDFSIRWLSLQGVKDPSTLKFVENFSELETFFDKPIYQYSSGMKARLFFSVATAIPGKIYLIDEVLSVGDAYFQDKCWGHLRQLFKSGASGILVTHDWSAILKLCENAYVLEEGKMVDSGSSQDVVYRYLELENKFSKESYFSDPQDYHGISHEDLNIRIPIHVTQKGDVFFSYSIESFHAGEGWSHVLHMDSEPLNIKAPGKYSIELQIPSLPLKEGIYHFNINLSQMLNGELKAVDSYSWTTGKSLKLIVKSPSDTSESYLPIIWSFCRD